jgi:hypothetical protein
MLNVTARPLDHQLQLLVQSRVKDGHLLHMFLDVNVTVEISTKFMLVCNDLRSPGTSSSLSDVIQQHIKCH